MAEGGEGGGKAGDLYLGVVDLFAVLLPGLLLTGVAWKVLTLNRAKEVLEAFSGPEFIPKWLIFLIVAYVAGHFLFAMGAWMMDPLYDRFYKRWFEFERKKELPSMRRRADCMIHEILGEALHAEGDNRLTWSEAFLTASAPAAKTMLDRLEADSKFFRSLAVVTILSTAIVFSPLTGWITPWQYLVPAGILSALMLIFWLAKTRRKKSVSTKRTSRESFDIRVKLRLLGNPKPPPAKVDLPSRFTWSDAAWLRAEAAENAESMRDFRWFARLIPIVWTILVFSMVALAGNPLALPIGAGCWSLAIASVWRYMEIRAKRLLQAYYLVIAIHKSGSFHSDSA